MIPPELRTRFQKFALEIFLHASNPIGQTEWEDGDIGALSLGPNDKGSLDVYVTSPASGGSKNFILTLFVSEA